MAITIGQKLGLYEITAFLGAGGMGQVFRARDTALQRDVALKLLPDAFASDADRLTRFQREAQVLASLNHPNIASIYGLEMSKPAQALVMELVEGPTLAERIVQGPIPIDEALGIARQLAEALEYAHESGVIHRDLKPANIKIAPDGRLKVLDFGLAKALGDDPRTSTMSNSPTLSLAATQAGVILGTAGYMSPEQAKGKTVDRRADIWAFGVVVYEMLTGKTMFSGETAAETMAQVMLKDSDMGALPANTPPRLRELLQRCLVKDPRNRVRDIGDVRIALDDIIAKPAAGKETTEEAVISAPSPGRRWLGFAAAVVSGALLASAVILWLWSPWRTVSPGVPVRLTTELGVDVGRAANEQGVSTLALSRDGTILAFVGSTNGMDQIFVRHLGQLQPSPLAGTSGAESPFFSPDGQWLAFFADGKLKKISVTGGAAVTLADAPGARGGSWGDDDSIIFAPLALMGLHRVSSSGGSVERLTKVAEGESHRWPEVLPGARAVLYMSARNGGGYDAANIVLQPLPAGSPKVLVRGGYHQQYVPSGHLLYIHDGTLFTVPFDLNRLEVAGQSVPAVEGIAAQPNTGAAQFAASYTGALSYLAGQSTEAGSPVMWMSHDGKTAPLRSVPMDWSNPHFSPDGRKLAIDSFTGGNIDVWIYEWLRDTLTRFTFEANSDQKPVWSPDGKRIAFASSRASPGTMNLYWQQSDGTGEVQRLTESVNGQRTGSFHPNGKYLAFYELTKQNSDDLMILPIEGDESSGWKAGKPSVFLNTPAQEREPMFSPDGRWIAYTSSESGRTEVFVRPFPGPGGKWQISTAGGDNPTWSTTRHELLYRAAFRIMAVSYKVEGDSFQAEKPRVWSEQPILPRARERAFDLHPDGERLAVAIAPTQPEERLDKVTFIFNFFDELRRIAPPSKK